ncbi:MAG TPA: hypothetical protein PKE55_01950 [Kiritimatiellia bacterium]|nr:hypothetical protein [Kiritimatiellia bacterium]
MQQTIDLVPGWNAVYVEVDPPSAALADLFSGLPVDIVAAHSDPVRGAQFVKNRKANLHRAYGWQVWYSPDRQDAFLSTLFTMQGGTPYLIHARTNVSLTLSGDIAPRRGGWTPNAYNFVGFSLESPGGPTFHQFFRHSSAHNHNNIYRLVDGTWRQVLQPANETMRSGEAFWIYCRGRSDYSGPLDVSTQIGDGLVLTSRGSGQLVFRNRTQHPINLWLEHVVSPDVPIPLSIPVTVFEGESGLRQNEFIHLDGGPFVQPFPTLEAGQSIRVPLTLRVQDAGPGERYSILKVVTDLGTQTYIPVTASRDDL